MRSKDDHKNSFFDRDLMIWNILWVLFCILVIIRLFYRLGAYQVMNTDEAWYGVNTIEMLKSHNWIVPTLRYEVDYGSKPPLGLWMILISYKLFGVNPFALRFSSALFGALLFLVISVFLYRLVGARAAVFFSASFFALREPYLFHMLRSGDVDSLYCLLIYASIVCLYLYITASSDGMRTIWDVTFGLCAGLAFITKSANAVIILLMAFLCLPIMLKRIRIIDICISGLAMLIPVAVWVVLRIPYDGFAFFNAIVFGEIKDKVGTERIQCVQYIVDMVKTKMIWILCLVLILYACNRILSKKKGIQAEENRILIYIETICFITPMLFYMISGQYMSWYTYPSYIAACMLIGTLGHYALLSGDDAEKNKKKKRCYTIFVETGILAFCIIYGLKQLSMYQYFGLGGAAIQQFSEHLGAYQDLNGDVNAGKMHI